MEDEGSHHHHKVDECSTVVWPPQPVDGVSAYDYSFKTYRCCKCQEPIALSGESEGLLVRHQLDEWYRYNEVLSPQDEERVRLRVSHDERGEQLSLNQYIHCRCLAPMGAPDLAQLRAKGRFELPSRATHKFTELSYSLGQSMHCAYCQIVVNQCSPGVAYQAIGDDGYASGPVRHLHLACYARLSKQRQTPLASPQQHYNEIPVAAGELGPRAARQHNMAWEEAMGRRRLAPHEIEVYRKWRDARAQQRIAWSAEQRAEWEALGADALEAREGDSETVSEQELNDTLAAASYPLNGALLRETRVRWNLLRAEGAAPVETVRKRRLDDD
jgi:hypothetical protein